MTEETHSTKLNQSVSKRRRGYTSDDRMYNNLESSLFYFLLLAVNPSRFYQSAKEPIIELGIYSGGNIYFA